MVELNKAQLSPSVIDFKKFNEMMSRRGMGTQHVSVMNPETSPEGMSNPKVKEDSEKLKESSAGAVGPFTVKIKHDDGYEDEVTSENHSMAMDKAALTVTDNYAPDLTDVKQHLNDQATKIQNVKDAGAKHADFEESLRPQVEKLLDEHVKTWADRRAKLIDTINHHTGLKLGPLDNIQTREVHEALGKHLENEMAAGRSNLHPVRDAYAEITGQGAPISDLRPGGYHTYLKRSPNGLTVRGGDELSGAPHFPEWQIPVGEKEEEERGRYVVSDWKENAPKLRRLHETWKNSISKGIRPTDIGTPKHRIMDSLSLGGSNGRDSREGFSTSLGIKNPHPEMPSQQGHTSRDPILPPYSRRTTPRSSTYEMYDSTGKKLHSGTISADYDTAVDEKGESLGDVYSTTKRFNVRIEPKVTNG